MRQAALSQPPLSMFKKFSTDFKLPTDEQRADGFIFTISRQYNPLLSARRAETSLTLRFGKMSSA